jgi:hypothetical protein
MRKELTMSELEAESVELLPTRETLHVRINLAKVFAVNLASATNIASHHSLAAASAHQNIVVLQH